MSLNKRCLLVLLSLLLVACEQQVLRPVGQYQPESSHYKIKQWSIDGRVAVQIPKDSFSASLFWRHRPGEEVLELSGPFGQGRTVIEVLPASVRVDDGRQSRIYHQPAEAVFRHYFSIAFPVHALSFWLLGLADPAAPVVLNNNGFVQNGWRIEYKQDQRVGDVFLPRKIRLSRQQTKIKIIIDQWKIR